ncbi:MAG: glycosyltransferase, partial [Xanthomonadales bacterium]|nr:glycosyltransferase [Xanthomonadales bacterium]
RWQFVGNAQVMYLPAVPNLGTVSALLRATPHELIYLQSAFDPHFSILPLIANRLRGRDARPVLLAPRGEFSPGALALKAPKKRLFMALARATGLWRGVTWQASADNERVHILAQIGPSARIAQASDIPSLAPEAPPAPAPSDLLRVAFLSRISPKKNLAGALNMLARLPASVPVRFTIYGPQEDAECWQDCAVRIARLPNHVSAKWGGSVPPEQVHATLAGHDLFLFPTFGENFGHVIVDAMSAGLPLLLSDQTPWRELAERGVGADLPLADTGAFVRWIEDYAAMTQPERQAMRAAVLALASTVTKPTLALEANRTMLQTALQTGRP